MRQSRTIFAIFAITLLLSAEARIATADKWNFDLSFRFMDALAAKQPSLTPAEKASIQKVLAIRNARAEVAIGIAAQKAPGMLAAYRNILNRMICINTVAFEGQPENKIFGGLFALPGSEYEATWTAQDKCKGKAFAKLDDDRWGPFLTKTDLAGNTADVKAAIAGDNVRSHMHLLARASLYGECGAIDNWDKIATHVPGSFRHALMIIKATPAKMTKAKADCKLNEAKLLHQTSRVIRGKNIIEFEDTSARTADGVAPGPTNVAEARKPRSPNFRSMRVMKNGVAFNPPSVPVAGWNGNTWTQARLVGTDQPPLSAGEQAFIRANDPSWTIDKAPPLPGAGGNVFDMKETADGQNTKGNSLWRNAMIANGFLMDAGPSGTTDEIAQFGDLTSVTNDLAGACGVRYGPLSGMLLQTHHSFAEVVQGMGDGNRAAPIFSFKAPYDSIKVCADGFFDSAVKKFKDLSRPGDAQAALVLGSDFGVVTEGGVAKPRNEAASDTPAHTKFRIEDEGADGTVFNNKVCILGPQNFPTGASGWEMLCAASPTWAQVASKFAEVDEEDEAVEDEAEEDEDAEDEEEDEADEEDEEEDEEEEEEEDLEFLEEEAEDEDEDEETEETEFLEEEEEEEEEDEEEEEEEEDEEEEEEEEEF